MSTSVPTPVNATGDDVQHAADDRLEPREMEQLFRGAIRLDPAHSIEAEFAIVCSGRLGMRAGEIAHLREEWIDWRECMIHVPRHQRCQKGRDGGVCGYCKQLAQSIIANNPDLDENTDVGEIMWQPKTRAASRAIPFEHDTRAELVLERFFETFNRWSKSRTGVNRKVNRAALRARELDPDGVYPHCLRAAAATRLASDLTAIELQSMFGWATIDTARKYVRISGQRIKKSLG